MFIFQQEVNILRNLMTVNDYYYNIIIIVHIKPSASYICAYSLFIKNNYQFDTVNIFRDYAMSRESINNTEEALLKKIIILLISCVTITEKQHFS